MKFGYLFIILCTLYSCKGLKETISINKSLKGEWLLSDITYSENGTFDVIFYDDAPAECLEGSVWKFIPNNNSGKYVVNSNECTATGPRSFLWTVPKEESTGTFSFMIKPVDAKGKSKNGNKGYRNSLTFLDETKMTWTQRVQLEGKPFVVSLNFIKLTQN